MTEKAKVLFVDDERQVLISLRALFRSQYQVFIADGGEAALDIIRNEPIQVVVSDQRMPKMLGHELLREVKKLRPGTVRLLLTGYSDMGGIMNSINDGEVFRFVQKPWDNDELRSTLDNAVQISFDTQDIEAVDDDAEDGPDELVVEGTGVLVIDDDSSFITRIKELVPEGCPLYDAHQIEDALDILAQEDIAVIISDVTLNGEDITDFIKLLKQKHPALMTIVLTEVVDSQMALDLINQARVYRYYRKSIGNGVLSLSIKNGLRFYKNNKDNVGLLMHQQVEEIKVIQNPSLVEKMSGRFKSLRERFASVFGFRKDANLGRPKQPIGLAHFFGPPCPSPKPSNLGHSNDMTGAKNLAKNLTKKRRFGQPNAN